MIANVTGRKSGDNHRILYWTLRLMAELEAEEVEAAPFRDRELAEMGVWIRSPTGNTRIVALLVSRLTAVLGKQKIEHSVRRFIGADSGTGKATGSPGSSEKA